MSNFSIALPVIPADGSVTTAKLADGAVTTAKVAAANVTGPKMSARAVQFAAGFPGTGAGSIALPLALVGQHVGSVCLLDTIGGTSSDVTSNFESTITVDGHIQQTGGVYTGKLILVLLIATT